MYVYHVIICASMTSVIAAPNQASFERRGEVGAYLGIQFWGIRLHFYRFQEVQICKNEPSIFFFNQFLGFPRCVFVFLFGGGFIHILSTEKLVDRTVSPCLFLLSNSGCVFHL